MLRNWQNWCRLCAKIDFPNEDTTYKAESLRDQMEIVNKYFMISLLALDEINSSICMDCSHFLIKLERFGDQCIKTDQMFRELNLRKDILDEELQSIRLEYGVDRDEIKYSSVLPEEQSKAHISGESPDPLDMQPECVVTVKEESNSVDLTTKFPIKDIKKKKEKGKRKKELLEVDDAPVLRKRGRPRNTAKSLNVSSSNVKEEGKSNDSDTDCENADEVPDQARDEDSDYTPEIVNRSTEAHGIKKKRRRGSKTAKEKENQCEICLKKFCRKSVLKEHILEQHRQEEMPFVCSQCPRRFTNKYKLKIHETLHLPEDQRRTHACPYCEKKFRVKFILQTHINAMHIGDKPFICEECGNSFRTKGALNQHQTIHTEERPCQCSFCPKKFKKKQHLKRHEESHKNHMFECPHCDLKLKNSRTLKMHLLVHSDHKQYKCNYCGNEYKRAKTLKDHLILHTGQRPYECPFCDKTFANGSNCRSHKRKAHPIELAALEASGAEQQRVTNTPKLEFLQPKHEVPPPSPPASVNQNYENGK